MPTKRRIQSCKKNEEIGMRQNMNKNAINNYFTCSRQAIIEKLIKSDIPPSREGWSRGWRGNPNGV